MKEVHENVCKCRESLFEKQTHTRERDRNQTWPMQKTTSPQIKTREEKGIKTVFVPLYQCSGRNNQKKLFECYASMTKQPKEPGLRVFRVWKMQIFPREICFPVQLSVLYMVYKHHAKRILSFVAEGSKWERTAWKTQGQPNFKTQINGHSK